MGRNKKTISGKTIELINPENDTCNICGKEKPIRHFYKNKCIKKGYSYTCASCSSEYNKQKYGSKLAQLYCKKGGYGIYQVKNEETGEFYIGKGWLNERKVDHFTKLKAQKHSNKYIQQSYNKNNNFTFIILERCEPEEGSLKEREHLIKNFLEFPNLILNQHITIKWQ